jgi:hypothetical protein
VVNLVRKELKFDVAEGRDDSASWTRERGSVRRPILVKFITAVCVTAGQLPANRKLIIDETDVH